MKDPYEGSITFQEMFLFFIMLAMMRGCYHVGSIAEKVNPAAYDIEDLPDPGPTDNGLYPPGFQPFSGN